MNNYFISCVVNDKPVNIPQYSNFSDVYESFLLLVEEAIQNKYPIDKVCMTFKDSIIATDVSSVVKIGAAILNSGIIISYAKSGVAAMVRPIESFLSKDFDFGISDEDMTIGIIGQREKPFVVLPITVMQCNLPTYFEFWAGIANEVRSLVQSNIKVVQKDVDNSWMLEYYVRNELKQIQELLDIDIQEAKKRIRVMQYMISNNKDGL